MACDNYLGPGNFFRGGEAFRWESDLRISPPRGLRKQFASDFFRIRKVLRHLLSIALQLGNDTAKWTTGEVNLAEMQDNIAIAHFTTWLQQQGDPDSSWVRELVTGGRDPATGQTYLDRRIPEIIASMPEEAAYNMRWALIEWYLVFGFLDRYFELILDLPVTYSVWTNAEIPVHNGTIRRRLGFTAHPQYLEVAESMGLIDVWEQRGPPDFCEKISGQWVCE